MAGKFRNVTTAAAAENGDELYKNLNNVVYNDNTVPEKKIQVRLMCSWGFSEKLIKYLSSRTRNLSVRDLDFIRICCIFIPEEEVENFCKKHFNSEFTYETIIDELADEHIRQRMPDFSFDELKSLKDKNDGLKAALDLHKQYLELLKDQASLIRAEKNKADNDKAEEIARWRGETEKLTAELHTAGNRIEALEKKLAVTEKAEREWKEKAEARQAGLGANGHMAQIDKSVQKALLCIEEMEKSGKQRYTKLMGKLEEVLDAQRKSRKKSGPFNNIFGRNEPKEDADADNQKIEEDPNIEKQAFITEIMAEKRFSEIHYSVLGYLIDLLPVSELRAIADPGFDEKRLRFISEWYCRSHGIEFNFYDVVESSDNKDDEEADEEIENLQEAEAEVDEDEVLTSEEDEDD